jgi:EpsI family protein
VTLTLRFPLAFLWFAVPVGVFVSPLQDFTARFTARTLELSGIPVLLEGRFLFLPFGRWEVAAACSGAHYLTASLMVGCLYASAMYQSWPRRIGFLVASAAVPVLANGVRAYGIIMLAYVSDNKIATGVDHVIYGWVFFSIVMLLLFALGWPWREDPRPPFETPPTEGGSSGRPEAGLISRRFFALALRRPLLLGPSLSADPCLSTVPGQGSREGFSEEEVNVAGSTRGIALTAAAAVVLVAVAPLWARVVASRASAPRLVRAAAPQVNPPWRAQDAYAGNWVPRFPGAAAAVLETYTAGDRLVDLYIGYYASERQGAEVISSENAIADKRLWQATGEGTTRVTVDGRPLRVRETVIRSRAGVTRLAWTWYWVAGAFTSDPYEAKVRLAAARLFGRAAGSAVVAVASDCGLDCHAAADALQSFLSHSASLEATLRGFSKSDAQG